MGNSTEARLVFLDHKLAEFACLVHLEMRIRGSREKHVLKEAMKGVLPETLYNREKFAFMAPPAHTDEAKWNKFKTLLNKYASDEKLHKAQLIDAKALADLIEKQEDKMGIDADKVQVDAILNHVLGVMLSHHHFVATDLSELAYEKAQSFGWTI